MSFDDVVSKALESIRQSTDPALCILLPSEEHVVLACRVLVCEFPAACIVTTAARNWPGDMPSPRAIPDRCSMLVIRVCEEAPDQVNPAVIEGCISKADRVVTIGVKTRNMRTRRTSASPREVMESPRSTSSSSSHGGSTGESPRTPRVLDHSGSMVMLASPKTLRRTTATNHLNPGRDAASALLKQ